LKKAIVLLSGGLDSATTALIASSKGFSIYALTFSYGQKHSVEISFSKKIAECLKVKEHKIIDIDTSIFKSALTDKNISVPKDNYSSNETLIPATYVPARNILFLSYALAYAESMDIFDIFIGANAVDYSGYPDCRPEFFQAYQSLANLGTKAGVEGKTFNINTPIIDLKKSEIIKIGADLEFDYSLTHSCYSPSEDGLSCGHCDSCLIRKQGFKDAGILDPTKYY